MRVAVISYNFCCDPRTSCPIIFSKHSTESGVDVQASSALHSSSWTHTRLPFKRTIFHGRTRWSLMVTFEDIEVGIQDLKRFYMPSVFLIKPSHPAPRVLIKTRLLTNQRTTSTRRFGKRSFENARRSSRKFATASTWPTSSSHLPRRFRFGAPRPKNSYPTSPWRSSRAANSRVPTTLDEWP